MMMAMAARIDAGSERGQYLALPERRMAERPVLAQMYGPAADRK